MIENDNAKSAEATESELHRSILESLPEAVVATTFAGEIVFLNTAAKRLLGTNMNAARGQPLAKIVTILDGTTRAPVASPLTRFVAHAETRESGELDVLVRRDGTEVPIEVTCTLLRRAADGVSRGVLLTMRNGAGWSELAERATRDPLTRLVNRAEFEQRLERLLAKRCNGDEHALLFMDLNRFKHINDTYGHLAGDSVLRQVAALFGRLVRGRDTLARIGGDEFALLLPHCPIETAREHARTLREHLRAERLTWQNREFYLDVAIGVAALSAHSSASEVLAAADRACYAAKHRECHEWHFPLVASSNRSPAPRTYL